MRPKRKKILIIYTGGTIGMLKTSQGYSPAPGLLEHYMAQMPEFKHPSMPAYDLIEYTQLLDSSDMSTADWNNIAEDIYKHYEHYDAFLILHGTDTLAYTSSALSFMLQDLNKPVILTGSQVPLMEIHTDARNNLIHAMLLAGVYPIAEVCIFFNNLLLRGNRAHKFNAHGFDAFISANFPPLGQVGSEITVKTELLLPKPQNNTLTLQTISPQKIAIFKFFPGVDLSLLKILIEQPLQALILETYGVGNAPTKEAVLLDILGQAKQQDLLLINTSQCLKSSVNMQSYATGQALTAFGVLSSYDMSQECIIAKLYYLLSRQTLTNNERRQLFMTPLCGEMNK